MKSSKLITGDSAHLAKLVTSKDADEYLSILDSTVPWTKMKWGRSNLPRDIFRYDDFGSGKVEILEDLAIFCEAAFECRVKSAWCNRYNDGADYTPFHQDQYNSHVITFSFGGARRFICKNISTQKKREYLLGHGDVFYFSPEFDNTHQHSIAKTAKAVDSRISIVLFCSKPYNLEDANPPQIIKLSDVPLDIVLDMFGSMMEQGVVLSLEDMGEMLGMTPDDLCDNIVKIYGLQDAVAIGALSVGDYIPKFGQDLVIENVGPADLQKKLKKKFQV